MSDPLVFMMGKYEATIPTDRLYAKNHTWAQKQGEFYQFGFTAYAVRLLQDVYFLEWNIDDNTPVTSGQEIGFIESSKAESDLYAPKDGNLVRFNPDLMNDPSLINVDLYGQGWLFEIDTDESELLSPEEYMKHLEAVWEVTQRTIKGQLNE
ncbi:MAG: glycine cleavage system protein H [Blastopirellula sp.]|nr:MAG: glycine cleavage system protein H [Blastopirellula sp.]